jgi:hypothetical protein
MGAPQPDCGGPLGIPPSLGVQRWPCCAPPLDAVGDFVWTRARVSPGLGLAPALLLGLGLPFPLSLWLLPSSSLALTHAPQAQAQAGIPPTPGVVIVATLFLRLVL